MSTGVFFLVMSWATYRLTRLLIEDTITVKFRRAVLPWLKKHKRWGGEWVATLLSCPYCVSVWFAGGVTFISPTPNHLSSWDQLMLALGIAGASLLWYGIIDGEGFEIILKQQRPQPPPDLEQPID